MFQVLGHGCLFLKAHGAQYIGACPEVTQTVDDRSEYELEYLIIRSILFSLEFPRPISMVDIILPSQTAR